MNKRRNTKQRKCWLEDNEAALLEVWADKLPELRGPRKNTHIFKEMAEMLSTVGSTFTADEVKIKIHNLTNRYRKEKKLIGPSGGSPSGWPLYHSIHAILGDLRIHNLKEVVEDSILIDPVQEEFLDDPYPSESSTFSLTDIEERATEFLDVDVDVASSADVASTSTSTPAAKKRKCNSDRIIIEQLSLMKKSDDRLIQIEAERNVILERFVNSCELLQKDIYNLLNK